MDTEENERRRFKLSCRMLRRAGYFNTPLPGAKRNESHIDWMVRHGIAETPRAAARALIEARGLTPLVDELLKDGIDLS
jgi:hypothetical protein